MPQAEKPTQLERALRGLRALVLDGAFPAEARLSEVALAERLGLSRTPLRQAMDRLVAEGLLERIETGGVRVARFTLQDVIDGLELRGVLEGTAVRLAAERGADPAHLAEAAATLDALDVVLTPGTALDIDAYGRLNGAFHAQFARLSGSPVVARELDRIVRLPLVDPAAFLLGQEVIPGFRPSLDRAQVQHRAILEAIDRREGARAEALAREHARLARSNLDYLSTAAPGLARDIPGFNLVVSG
ncbi:MAG: GntR family transcriptional regulator [Pseudomonadota bacterium]